VNQRTRHPGPDRGGAPAPRPLLRGALAALILGISVVVGLFLWWPADPPPVKAQAPAARTRPPRAPRPPAPSAAPAEAPPRAVVEVRCALQSPDRGAHPPLDRLLAEASDGSWAQPVWPRPVEGAAGAWELSLWLDQPLDGAVDIQNITLRDALIEPLRLRVEGGVCTAPPLRFQPGLDCPLGPELAAALDDLREGVDWVAQAEGGGHLPSRRAGARLTIWPEAPAGRGRLLLPGQPPAPLRWTEAGCAPLHSSPTATVRGRLIDPLDQGGPYFVEGCGARALVGEDLRFTLQIAAAEPCQLEAWRMDGPLRALAEPAGVQLAPGDELELELELPEVRMAGLGIAFRVEEGGVRALKVHEGSPAWEAGLREGDLIVEVDGQATPGMSENDFVAFGTGPSGSVARLVVSDEQGDAPVDVRRGELSRLLR
jgi:hypothetical protein